MTEPLGEFTISGYLFRFNDNPDEFGNIYNKDIQLKFPIALNFHGWDHTLLENLNDGELKADEQGLRIHKTLKIPSGDEPQFQAMDEEGDYVEPTTFGKDVANNVLLSKLIERNLVDMVAGFDSHGSVVEISIVPKPESRGNTK